MIPVPEMKRIDVAFGNIDHLPKYDDLPDEFRRMRGPYCDAISTWFFRGARRDGDNLVIGDDEFAPREGVDAPKAIAAISAALGSFEPKHEHKIGGCGYLLHEWFALTARKGDTT